MRARILLCVTMMGGACGDPDTGSGAESSGAGEATSTTAATDTSTGSDTGEDDPTTEPGTTGATGDEDLCVGFCEQVVACQPGVTVAGCVDSFCEEEPDGTPGCLAAIDARHACFAGMSCDDLLAFIEEEDPGPCSAAVADEVKACTGEKACEYVANGALDDSACEIDFECIGEPPQTMKCDPETCTCFEDGRTVGECASRAICASVTDLASFDLLVELAAPCCGFGNAA